MWSWCGIFLEGAPGDMYLWAPLVLVCNFMSSRCNSWHGIKSARQLILWIEWGHGYSRVVTRFGSKSVTSEFLVDRHDSDMYSCEELHKFPMDKSIDCAKGCMEAFEGCVLGAVWLFLLIFLSGEENNYVWFGLVLCHLNKGSVLTERRSVVVAASKLEESDSGCSVRLLLDPYYIAAGTVS